MTENDKKQNINITKEQTQAQESKGEQHARWAMDKLNTALRGLGLPEMDIEPVMAGLKAGTILPNYIVGGVEEAIKYGTRVVRGAAKLASRLSGVPYIGSWFKVAADVINEGLKFASGLVDRVKDALVDISLSGINARIGDLKGELDGTNEKLDKQGEAMADGFNKLESNLKGTKSELDAKLSSQGEKQGNLQSQTNRLNNAVDNLSQAHSSLKAEVSQQFSEVNERIDTTEVKITKNARDILEEKLEREAIDNELRDKIKENKLQLNNLNEQQEELREDFQSYQTKTDRKLDEVHQEIENTQEEFTHQLKIQETKIQLEMEETREEFERANHLINAKIHQTQEILEEYEEEVNNIRHDQKRLNVEFQELTDDVETQFELIHQQTRKLDLVADQMGEIAEETNRRMDKLENTILDIEEQAEEALSTARKATRQVNQLTEDLQKERKRIKNLEESITKNRQETKQAKAEAQRANERIDNLIKTQQLADFSKEQLAFAKLEKTLQLKAEETKLLAQLNILNQTQKLIPEPEPAEREWKVGIQEGTERQIPRPEGMPLVAGSRWEQEHSLAELREMGWDVRIEDKNESAPLTTPDRRKPEKAPPQTTTHKEQTAPQTSEEQQALREQVESAKTQILEQIKELQEQANQNITPLEEEKPAPDIESEDEEAPSAQLLEEQEKDLRKQRATTKAQLTRQQNKQQATQKEITQLKSAITKETKQLKQAEKKLAQPTTPPQKKELQNQQQASQQKLAELQQTLQEKQEQLNQQNQPIQQSSQKIEELSQKIEQIQAQSSQAQQSQAEKELQPETQQNQAEVAQAQQEILQQQWQQISQAQQQVIEEQAESQESPPNEQAEKEAQEQAEAEQEVEKAEEEAAATQNQMTLMMLFLIIFLLEYIVYKRNGLPGLVVLNIILAIAYYNKDTIIEYQHLWNDYILIIAYITGNVLTYNAIEKPENKWPAVAGYNAIIALIYAYTKWKEYQAQQKQESAQKKLTQTKIKQELNKNQIQEKELPVKFYNWEEKIQDKPLQQTAKFQQELNQAIQKQVETKKKAEFVEKQTQIAQEQERIAQELKEQQEKIQQALHEVQQTSLNSSAINTEGMEQRFPGFSSEFQRVKDWLYSILPASQKTNTLANLLKETNLTPEERNLLAKLYLTDDQILNTSLRSKKVKNYETELRAKYSGLTPEQKLKLLNLGLQALNFKTPRSKADLVQVRQQILTERQSFDLSYPEKEQTLNFFITQLALTDEQQDELDNLGIAFVNANNWKTTPKHRQALLKIGLQKIKLNPAEKQNISQPNPKLTNQNENLLKTLAPLAKEYKYSPALLKNIQNLNLKYETLSFFIQQQILPDTNLEFGQSNDPYKLLKQQIIEKEQKKLFRQQQEREKEAIKRQMEEIRESLLPNLIEFSQNHQAEEFIELELPIYQEKITYQEKGGITFGKEIQAETWTNLKAIDLSHSNLLFTHGFKATKKYDYFELLVWAFSSLNSTQELTFDWTKWQNISPEFTQELVQEWQKWGFNYQQTKEWIDIGLSVQDAQYCAWLRQENLEPNWVLNEGNEDALCQQFEEAKNNLIPLNQKQLTWNQFLSTYPHLEKAWKTYLLYQAEKLQTELEANRQELADREAIATQKQNKKINLAELIPSLAQYIDKKFEETGRRTTYTSSTETTWTPTETNQNKPNQPEQTSSRYDDLLNNLSQEEKERQQKKKSREDARRKLDDLEFNRREQNLDSKQQKIQAEEERRQRERELEEQELKARQQAFEARQQELREQEEKRLTSQAEQIETKKKMAEEALAIKQKEAELAEQRKRTEIEKMEKENEQEQQRLEMRSKLIEEEMQKRLARIALEDQESRQRIEKECQERKAQLEREVLELKRKNERDLMLKEQELEKEKAEKEEQISHLRKEASLAEKNFQEMQSKIAEEKQASDRLGETTSKAREQKLMAGEVHKKALPAVYEYYLDDEEISSCCSGTNYKIGADRLCPSVRKLFDHSPEMRINLFNAKVMSSGESGDKIDVSTGAKSYYWNAKELTTLINKCLGNASYSKEGLETKIKTISDGGFFG